MSKLIKVPDTQNLYYKEIIQEYEGRYGLRTKTIKRYTLRYLDSKGKRRQKEIGDDLTISQLEKIQQSEAKKSEVQRVRKSRKRKPIISMPVVEEKVKFLTVQHLAEYYRDNNIDKKSNTREFRTYELHIKDRYGSRKADTITQQEIKNFYIELQNRFALKTAGNIILILKKYFNYAIKEEYFEGKNKLSNIDIVNPNNERVNFLNKEQIQQLLDHPKIKFDKELYLFVLLSTRTGARANSILKIKKADIKLSENTVELHNFKKKATEKKKFLAYFDEITKQTLKEIIIEVGEYDYIISATYASLRKKLQRVLDELFNYKDRDSEATDSKGRVKNPKEHLYSRKDLRTDNQELSKEELEIRATRRKQRIVVHSLRHSFAYNFLNQDGSSIFKLKELLNHSDIKMTLRYAHDDKEVNKQIIKGMYD